MFSFINSSLNNVLQSDKWNQLTVTKGKKERKKEILSI